MIPGFSAGLSGLQASQTRLDVSANNVANVNTNGFKASRVEQSSADVATSRVASPNQLLGLSVGQGTQITGTSTNFSSGALVRTDYPSDLSIGGAGFFEVVAPDGNTFFTRNGDFVRDAQGFLRSPEGGFLSAGGSAVRIPNNAVEYSVAGDGTVTSYSASGAATTVAQIDLATFPNNNGLLNTGGGLYKPTAASGLPDYRSAGTGGTGAIQQGYLEASNVDVANEIINQIISQRSFEASARVISAGNEATQALLGIFEERRR
jgi:flagellar basal-body rod protein FlgG